MRTSIIAGPVGVEEAVFGVGLSYGATSGMDFNHFRHTDKLKSCIDVAYKLTHMQGGHNKFLESIQLWLDVTAPRYWWQEFDTYRVGTTKQSESTIHTISRRPLEQKDFEQPIPEAMLSVLNGKILYTPLEEVKNILPEGFLQRRIVNTNLKTLQNMYQQRKNHKLVQWHDFFIAIAEALSVSPYEDFIRYCLFKDDYKIFLDITPCERSY